MLAEHFLPRRDPRALLEEARVILIPARFRLLQEGDLLLQGALGRFLVGQRRRRNERKGCESAECSHEWAVAGAVSVSRSISRALTRPWALWRPVKRKQSLSIRR